MVAAIALTTRNPAQANRAKPMEVKRLRASMSVTRRRRSTGIAIARFSY
ncbi:MULTISPECIES: hypothetical protein [unclassified Azospirillum]|nr:MULTISPECIES: hypothetical protein [unclassified Azospirillum]